MYKNYPDNYIFPAIIEKNEKNFNRKLQEQVAHFS